MPYSTEHDIYTAARDTKTGDKTIFMPYLTVLQETLKPVSSA